MNEMSMRLNGMNMLVEWIVWMVVMNGELG